MNNVKMMRAPKKEDFKKICHESGFKYTRQRFIIFTEVMKSSVHPDAEAVYDIVRRQLENISLDTVYRTLWLFKDRGLLTTLGGARERTRFDANTAPHHHFVCTSCGAIHDVDQIRMDMAAIQDVLKGKGRSDSFQVTIQGICKGCDRMEARALPTGRTILM